MKEGRKEKSEKARKEALERQIKERLKSQQIVQKALKADLDGDNAGKNANHIVFDSSDDEDNSTQKQARFDEMLGFKDGNDEELLPMKPQFEGKDGVKLMKMQQKIGHDSRFQVDERFLGEDDEEEEVNKDEETDQVDASDEFKRNLDILEQVVGKQKKRTVQFVDMNKRRYDPSKLDHEKFLVKPTESEEPVKKKKKKLASELPPPPVKKERFVQLNYDKLKKDFSNENQVETEQPFTLSSLFGGSNEEEEITEKEDEEIQVDSEEDYDDNKRLPHFSHYDDSSSDEDVIEDNYYQHSAKQDYNIPQVTQDITSKAAKEFGEKDLTSIEGRRREMNRISRDISLFPTSEQIQDIIKLTSSYHIPTYEEQREKWLEVKDTLREDYRKKRRDYVRAQKRQSKTGPDNGNEDWLKDFF